MRVRSSCLVRVTTAIALVALAACGGSAPETPRTPRPARAPSMTVARYRTPTEQPASSPVVDYLANERHLVATFGGKHPRIVMSAPADSQRVEWEFPFEGTPARIAVDIDRAAVEAARSSIHHLEYAPDQRTDDIERVLHASYIVDPAQEASFASLIASLRQVRAERSLDHDRYFELIAAFVQSIPYDPDAGDGRFPIEVLHDRRGDCDEKSRLLVGIAAREGYDVALFDLSDANHMAVGVRTATGDHRGTGYAYVEATVPSWVTFPFPDPSTPKPDITPTVVRIGSGPQPYESAGAIDQFVASRNRLTQQLAQEQSEIEAIERNLTRLRSILDRNRNDDDAGRVDEYNALVEKHATLAEQYNRNVSLANATGPSSTGRHPAVHSLSEAGW